LRARAADDIDDGNDEGRKFIRNVRLNFAPDFASGCDVARIAEPATVCLACCAL
jgi:hypothetical protein